MQSGAHATRQTMNSNGLVANEIGAVPDTGRAEACKRKQCATYASVSESSVSRLLATLFARPSESSLWYWYG